jgi:hypothetical protein
MLSNFRWNGHTAFRDLALAIAVYLCLSICSAAFADSPAAPTIIEIAKIESLVELPGGRASLQNYVRYYYVSAYAGTRRIFGIYIARRSFKPSEIPLTDTVIVGGTAEIPAPSDSECSVQFSSKEIESNTKIPVQCTTQGVIA